MQTVELADGFLGLRPKPKSPKYFKFRGSPNKGLYIPFDSPSRADHEYVIH